MIYSNSATGKFTAQPVLYIASNLFPLTSAIAIPEAQYAFIQPLIVHLQTLNGGSADMQRLPPGGPTLPLPTDLAMPVLHAQLIAVSFVKAFL